MIELWGYQYSVYSWIAHLALLEKNIPFEWKEINPFDENDLIVLRKINPLGKVPVLVTKTLTLYETNAITRYIDATFDGPSLMPASDAACAKQDQIISIVDNHAYWPMVRQVFANSVFAPAFNEVIDDDAIQRGMANSGPVLEALEDLLEANPYACGDQVTLSDIHLHPVLAYFCMAPQGRDKVNRHSRLTSWMDNMKDRKTVTDSRPDIP